MFYDCFLCNLSFCDISTSCDDATFLYNGMVQRARRSLAATAAGAVNKPWPRKVSLIRARRFVPFNAVFGQRPIPHLVHAARILRY